jgi:FPC/CPF motif-containing protein YcgG
MTFRQDPASANPFTSAEAVVASRYAMLQGDRLLLSPSLEEPSSAQAFVHDSLRALVLNSRFPCLGAKAAFGSGRYAMGLYGELGSAQATSGLAYDLFEFSRQQIAWGRALSSYAACFEGPVVLDEQAFEAALWRQLGALHHLDREHHEWDAFVSSDPEDPRFSFSFAGRAFFVVGLHAASSRWSRRFAWPTLIFNAHHQFERLRAAGRLSQMQARIRARELLLQGDLNPNLAEYGEVTEARQYSGRPSGAGWRCPFHFGERS